MPTLKFYLKNFKHVQYLSLLDTTRNIGHPRYKSCYNNFRSKSVSQTKTLHAQKHLFFYQACVTFTWLRFILHVLMYALNQKNIHCVKKCPNTEFFWSVFSRIRTEYFVSLCILSECVRIRENTDQKKFVPIWTLSTQ